MTIANGQIAIYQTTDGTTHLDVRLEQDSVWLTQRQMGEVFDTTPENILMHIKNIFRDSELEENATTKDFLVVRAEGNRQVSRKLKHYNLDAIISVGYRVNSKKGTQFRIWANNILKQYLIQGYALNEQKLREQQDKLAELRQVYFIVKNHSFSDGNKRIASAIFAWFLQRHDYLYNKRGEKRIADNALVAFTLLIAESKPEEKDTIVKFIINLINDQNG